MFGDDGEKYRWFLLPSEASLYLAGKKEKINNFKMPFFPRKSVKDSKIRSKSPSKSVRNHHVCAACNGRCDIFTKTSTASEPSVAENTDDVSANDSDCKNVNGKEMVRKHLDCTLKMLRLQFSRLKIAAMSFIATLFLLAT